MAACMCSTAVGRPLRKSSTVICVVFNFSVLFPIWLRDMDILFDYLFCLYLSGCGPLFHYWEAQSERAMERGMLSIQLRTYFFNHLK